MTTTGGTETGGIAESGFFGALIETARIVNVNIKDWSLDLVSEYGVKKFFDIQWMSPYLHFFNGEGIYVMPEVGALCWLCTPSAGKLATPFVLGFKTEVDQSNLEEPALNFKANRQTLNPGDIMMKTRDENFIILRRGGVIQIGATPITQRIYVPIGNLIRDICENYLLQTLAGDMEWCVDRVDQSDAGDSKTRFRLRSKTNAGEPEHAVILTAGSHPDDDNLRLSLIVRADGEKDSADVVTLTMDKEGSVSWSVEKDFTIDAKGDVSIGSSEGNVTLLAEKGQGSFTTKGNLAFESTGGTASMSASGAASVKGSSVTIDGKGGVTTKGPTNVGGSGGEPLVKGQALVAILNELIQGLYDASNPHGPAAPAPGFPVLLPVIAKLQPKVIATILSPTNKVT